MMPVSIGLSLLLHSILGPFDAGFNAGQACDNGKGSCVAGTDVTMCESKLKKECGTDFRAWMFLDDCGGHANPYHFHADLTCEYNQSSAGHSALLAIGLDGRGVYGKFESSSTAPTDLDGMWDCYSCR